MRCLPLLSFATLIFAAATAALNFEPGDDGESFTLHPTFLQAVTSMGAAKDVPGSNNHMR